MRKLYACVKKFISNHYRLSLFFVINIMLVSGIAVIYSTLQNLLFWPFAFSICALFRLTTYKKGKIPIFMIDYTRRSLELKYSGEELEEKYEEMSIKRATIYFIIAVLSCFAWIVCELLVFLI